MDETYVRRAGQGQRRPGGRPGATGARPVPVTTAKRRIWDPAGPYDLHQSLGVLQRGPYDPAYLVRGGAIWRASRTPEGPVTLRLATESSASDGRAPDDRPSGGRVPKSRTPTSRAVGGRIVAEAWGDGADWALGQLPALLGADDDPEAFVPHHALTREAHRRNPGLRLGRTGLVLESLIPAVLEQKVTSEEAYRGWRRLLRRFGEPAPGPGADEGLYVPPDARTWALIPSWEWHRAGVDGKRSAAAVRAVRRAARMEEAAGMEPLAAAERLRVIPGIGPWTAAETLQRSNGATDAVSVGDLHLPRIVGYALTGRRDTDDAGMLELLAPYEGQRHRAARLIRAAGPALPRRAPRLSRGDIARI